MTIPRITTKFYLLALASLPLLHGIAVAQRSTAPKREVRGVWIATTAGLDWPHSLDRAEQQESLLRIIVEMKRANFNTLFFQVRPRGDAYYRSHFEPWAENLAGTLGKDPGWDPLAFLLTEAHRAGLEVHAWFNVFKVRGQSAAPPSTPPHPSRSLSRWAVQYAGEVWLDPGAPEVTDYLLKVSLDLVKNYDIDGINFDFARYPGRDFPDDETYRRYGNGSSRDDWRRANVTRFISRFYDQATALKPMLKVGSSPLGVFRTESGGELSGSYHWFYQDAEGWLRTKKQDYEVPQLYWPIGGSGNGPDFTQLARSWEHESSGRQVFSGIAAFKEEVQRQLPAQIDAARGAGMAGEVFFRYGTLRPFSLVSDRYETPANIPPMEWKDPLPPLPPTNLAVTEIAPNIFHLEWTPPPPAADGDRARYYDIYRSSSPRIALDDAQSLAAITTSPDSYYIDTVKNPGGIKYYYAVTALDKGNNESGPSNVATGTVREVLALKGKLLDVASLSTAVSTGDGAPTLAGYQLADRTRVSLELLRMTAAGRDSLIATLVDEVQNKGTYVLGLREAVQGAGMYILRLQAGTARLEQPMRIGR